MNWPGYFVLFTLKKGQDPGLILVYFTMLSIYHEYLGYNNLLSECLCYGSLSQPTTTLYCLYDMDTADQSDTILGYNTTSVNMAQSKY